MAVANVLAAATTAGNSSTIAVTTATGPVVVSLMTVAGGSIPADIMIPITRLNSSATWSPTGMMLSGQSGPDFLRRTSFVLPVGSYRAERPVTSVAVGVDTDTGA